MSAFMISWMCENENVQIISCFCWKKNGSNPQIVLSRFIQVIIHSCSIGQNRILLLNFVYEERECLTNSLFIDGFTRLHFGVWATSFSLNKYRGMELIWCWISIAQRCVYAFVCLCFSYSPNVSNTLLLFEMRQQFTHFHWLNKHTRSPFAPATHQSFSRRPQQI